MQDSLRMILMGMLVACFVGIVLLAIYLVTALLKQHSLRQLYDRGTRDFRFVCELLRLYTNKNGIIKNPCLLRSYEGVPPRADAIVVGGGGVLILTVVDRPGQYKTPVNGNWSVWQDGETKQIPNALLPGKQYTSVLSGILVKNGLSCPIVNIAVLTDDYAEVDSLYEEYALTGDRLVPYVQAFARRRSLGRSGQAKLIKAIKAHHELCQQQLSSAMVGDATSIFDGTSVPIEDESQTADETAAPEMSAKSLSLNELFADAASDDHTDGDCSEEVSEETDIGDADLYAADADDGDDGAEDDGADDILAALLNATEQDDEGD